jgi:hypothetical protein
MTVSLANSNAFWTTKDGTNFDYAYVAFKDAVTGTATYYGVIPKNVAGTPAWNLVLHHHAESGAGGNAILTVSGLDFATNAAKDAALTALITTTAVAVSTSANTTISTLSGSNFDGTEAVATNNRLIVQVSRIGGDGSDTLGVQWNLEQVVLQIDVV